jgi:hypothetical protein
MPAKKAKDDKKKKDPAAAGALFIPAGLFLGFGVGFLINNVPAGMFVGLGLGFLGFVITVVLKRK